MPTTNVGDALDNEKIGLLDLMVFVGLCPSKSEARRLVTQGGVSVDDVKITDPNAQVDFSDKNQVIIKKGKKVFHKAVK